MKSQSVKKKKKDKAFLRSLSLRALNLCRVYATPALVSPGAHVASLRHSVRRCAYVPAMILDDACVWDVRVESGRAREHGVRAPIEPAMPVWRGRGAFAVHTVHSVITSPWSRFHSLTIQPWTRRDPASELRSCSNSATAEQKKSMRSEAATSAGK